MRFRRPFVTKCLGICILLLSVAQWWQLVSVERSTPRLSAWRSTTPLPVVNSKPSLSSQTSDSSGFSVAPYDGNSPEPQPYSSLKVSFQAPPSFCLPWNVSSDAWWTHHVDYTVVNETDTGYCFSLVDLRGLKHKYLSLMYNNQFHSRDCKNVVTKKMWQSGWGADMANVIDGLMYGLQEKRPFQILDNPWHYATGKRKQQNPVCPLKTMECYFLPIGNCPPAPRSRVGDLAPSQAFFMGQHPKLAHATPRWVAEFAARPRTWLRKAAYDFSKLVPLSSSAPDHNCTVIHVRRGDVVLHGNYSRRYYQISDYVKASRTAGYYSQTFFLVTDDANAILEAHQEFPDIDWLYIDRPRWNGSSGGFENHIPSKSPKLEVIILLTIFRLAPHCPVFVHSRSGLASHIAAHMKERWKRRFVQIDLDRSKSPTQIYSASNAKQRNFQG